MIKQKIKDLAFAYVLAILTVAMTMSIAQAQSIEESANAEESTSNLMLVRTHAGVEYVGEILSIDAREVLLRNEAGEEIIIPRHEVNVIESIDPKAMINGNYVGEDAFATRYFYSTNGLSMRKGQHYASLNYYGPEVHFALSDHLSVGLMSTWIAAPVVASAKLSIPVTDKFHLGVGALGGSLSWLKADAMGALGYGTATFGDRQRNLSVSAGVAGINNPFETGTSTSGLLSIAGMSKIGRRSSIVFDSFFLLGQETPVSILIPGLRVSTRDQKGAFQFGLGMAIIDGADNTIPFPMATYFINLR
ncbi:MAG: hypothetical protein AAF927_32095 [Bacteroidota bacterium]